MSDQSNYQDILNVLSGEKDLKVSFQTESLVLLFGAVFMAMFLALYLNKKL